MKCITENTQKFINIMDCIGDLFDFAELCFSEKGLIITCTDINKTIFMDLELNLSFFTQYKVDKQKVVVSLENLNIILGCGLKYDIMELSLIEDDTQLEITFLNQAENKRAYFKTSLKQFTHENLEIKNIQTNTYLCISSVELSNSIKHLSHLAHNLEIETKGKRVRFCVKGNFSSGLIEFYQIGDVKLSVQSRFKQLFSFKLLLRLCKIDKIEDRVNLFFQNNNNLVIHMDIEQNSSLTFHLAPKFVPHN